MRHLPLKPTTVCHIASLLLASLCAAGPAAAQERVGAIEVDRAWARSTAPDAKATTVYFTVRNTGTEPDRLVSVQSPVAGRGELRTYDHSGGLLKMSPLADGMPLPAGAELVLQPQGEHVMLIELARPLAKGERLPLEITFEQAGRLTVDAQVRGVAAD